MGSKRIYGGLSKQEWESRLEKYRSHLQAEEQQFKKLTSEEGLHIVLEKGEAKKSLFEMSPSEIREVSRRIFKIVTERAEQVGQKPVVIETTKS
jgi:hypothetical protein